MRFYSTSGRPKLPLEINASFSISGPQSEEHVQKGVPELFRQDERITHVIIVRESEDAPPGLTVYRKMPEEGKNEA